MNKIQNTSPAALLPEDSAESFVKLIRSGIDSLEKAAHMLKRLVDHDPEAIAKIRERDPSIPTAFFARLLQVAEGSLRGELLLKSSPAHLRLRGMPVTAQDAALKRGAVDLVIDADTGDHIRVPLSDLSPKQVSQVFDSTGIRSPEDQRAYIKLKSKPKPKMAKDDDFPWIAKRDRVIINRPCELRKKDILNMLSELES